MLWAPLHAMLFVGSEHAKFSALYKAAMELALSLNSPHVCHTEEEAVIDATDDLVSTSTVDH